MSNRVTSFSAGQGKAFVLLGYGLDADRYRERFLVGDEPDESPYGFHVARELGWSIRFSRDHLEGAAIRFLRRGLKKTLGFDVIHLWRNRRFVADSDVVWTMQESEWLALRFVALFYPAVRRPVIGNTVWLFDRWNSVYAPLRRLYRRLARGPGVLTVHSDRYLAAMQDILPDVRVERMYFATSIDAHPLQRPHIRERGGGPLRIFAAGNDRTRDWDTFLRAFGNDDRFDIELLCPWVGSETRSRYTNLRPRGTSTIHRLDLFQALYRWADMVVVPMRENRFSGITVALEAVASAKPVICSATGGVPTYFADSDMLYVPPGDPIAMRNAALSDPEVLLAKASAAQDRFRTADYSIHGMMKRYSMLSRDVLDPNHSENAR